MGHINMAHAVPETSTNDLPIQLCTISNKSLCADWTRSNVHPRWDNPGRSWSCSFPLKSKSGLSHPPTAARKRLDIHRLILNSSLWLSQVKCGKSSQQSCWHHKNPKAHLSSNLCTTKENLNAISAISLTSQASENKRQQKPSLSKVLSTLSTKNLFPKKLATPKSVQAQTKHLPKTKTPKMRSRGFSQLSPV